MYATDRQTSDVRQHHRLMLQPIMGGYNKMVRTLLLAGEKKLFKFLVLICACKLISCRREAANMPPPRPAVAVMLILVLVLVLKDSLRT